MKAVAVSGPCHILARLAHEIEVLEAPRLMALLEELESCPAQPHVVSTRTGPVVEGGIVVPLILSSEEGPSPSSAPRPYSEPLST